MRRPHIAGALAEPRIRPGPKRVVIVSPPDSDGNPTLPLGTGYKPSDAALDDLAELLEILREDSDPAKLARFYRRSARGDDLLRSDWRVLHLHLLHPGSDDIVYLVQRDDGVILVMAISDHRHLEETPRGKSFRLDRARTFAGKMPYTPPPPADAADE